MDNRLSVLVSSVNINNVNIPFDAKIDGRHRTRIKESLGTPFTFAGLKRLMWYFSRDYLGESPGYIILNA